MHLKKTIYISLLSVFIMILITFFKLDFNSSFDFKLFLFTAIMALSACYITTSITFQLICHDKSIIRKKKEIFQSFSRKTDLELLDIENKFKEKLNHDILDNIKVTLIKYKEIEVDKIDQMILKSETNFEQFYVYLGKFKIKAKDLRFIKRLLKYYNNTDWYDKFYCDFKSGQLLNIPLFQLYMSYIVSVLLSFFAAFGYEGWDQNLIIKIVILAVLAIIEIVSSIFSYRALKEDELSDLQEFQDEFNKYSK